MDKPQAAFVHYPSWLNFFFLESDLPSDLSPHIELIKVKSKRSQLFRSRKVS